MAAATTVQLELPAIPSTQQLRGLVGQTAPMTATDLEGTGTGVNAQLPALPMQILLALLQPLLLAVPPLPPWMGAMQPAALAHTLPMAPMPVHPAAQAPIQLPAPTATPPPGMQHGQRGSQAGRPPRHSTPAAGSARLQPS